MVDCKNSIEFQCSLCHEDFPSRNKLFKHLPLCRISSQERSSCSKPANVSSAPTESSCYLYVTGGRLRGKTLGTVERYSFSTGLWQKGPSLLENRGSQAAVAVNSTIYVCGGGGFKSNLATCERYDIGDSEWREIAPMKTYRHALSLVSFPAMNAIFAVGGWIDGSVCCGELEKYCFVTNTWTSCAAMAVPRRLLGAARRGGLLFAAGGNCADGEWNSAAVEVYSPRLDAWLRLPDLPHAGPASAVTVADKYLLVLVQGKGVFLYEVSEEAVVARLEEQLHFSDQHQNHSLELKELRNCFDGRDLPVTITRLCDLPLPEWFGFDVVSRGEVAYVVGGASEGIWSRQFYAYNFYENTWQKLPEMHTQRRRCASALVEEENTVT